MQNYPDLPDQDPTFLAELLEVGRVYAVLNPWLPDDFETNPLNSFLSTMWKAKYEDAIQQGSDEFGQFFAQFSEFDLQIQLVKMSRNLLQAAHRSTRTELKVEKHNARFLTGLVELGREYAEMEPGEASLASTENPSTFFLDTFWQSTTLGGQKGQEEFNAFFKDIRRPSQTVQLERHLLEAAHQSLALEEAEQKKDAALLRELLGLGRVYATLNPIDLLGTAEPANFFLNTLWTAKDATAVQTGSAEFESFIGDFKVDQRVHLLRLERTFLSAAKTSTDLRRTLRDPRVVRELVGLGALYTKLYSDAEEPEDSGMFLDMLWHHPDQSLSIASMEFNRLVTDVKGVRLNREAIFLGIRLLLAARNISELEPNLGDVQPKLRLLLQPLAHVASAYTALNPQKNSGTRSFVQTAWQAKNDATQQDFILQSSEELREFLAGTAEQPRFKTNEQPQVLDFVAKLLQAAKLSTKLSARQKRDSAILKMAFVDAARDAAKFHLTYPRGTGDDVTFWDRFWQAAVNDSGALQQGVRELDQYLTELGLPIETMGYIGKLWFALSMVGEKLGDDFQQIIRDIRENLGTILLILGIVGILLLIPVVNVGIALFLAILDVIFTVVSGVESIQAFFDFLVQVWQAENEAELELAAESLSRAILAGIGTLIGLAGFFRSLKVIKESAIAIKALSLNVIHLARRLPEKFPALLESFQLCGRAPGAIVLILRDFSSNAFRRLVQFAEYLKEYGGKVVDFLRKAPEWIQRVLESLRLGLNSAKQLIKDILWLLELPDMTVGLLRKLLGKEDVSTANLRSLFTEYKGLTPAELLELLDRRISIEQISTLKRLADERFNAISTTGNPMSQSLGRRGPVLTVIVDGRTGQAFYGQNTGLPSPLHPILQRRLNAYLNQIDEVVPPFNMLPGDHSEINALNQALYARRSVAENDLSEFILYNIRIKGAKQGQPIVRCVNCRYLTDGVTSLVD